KYQHRPELPFSPGCEVAGIGRGIGAGVTEVGLGERVFATMAWGGYAEVVAVDQRHVYALPDFMTFEEGAVFGLAYQTAWCGLVHRAGLKRGETLLVHAAAGGTGLAAVQLGRALGARVIATAGSAAKLDVARQLTPVIWRSFPLERASRALAAIASRESYGKVVLIP